MRSEYPEPIVLSPEGLHRGALCEVPDTHCLILTARNDELMLGVEECSGHVVEVTSARVDLPCLRLTHAPNLDLPVVRRRDDERKRGVERSPVDTAVMAFKHVLDSGEVVEGIKGTRRGVGGVLAQSRDVPHAYSLVLRSRDDQVFLRMKLRRHDIMGVPGEDGDAVSRGAVPDADRLVVGRRKLQSMSSCSVIARVLRNALTIQGISWWNCTVRM